MQKIEFTDNNETIIKQLSILNEDWVDEILSFLNEWWDNNDFIIAETSGSTGIPKKVKLDKEKVISSALATGDFFDFREGENALLCMSPKFIAGKLMIVRAIVWKLNLICVEPNSSPLESIDESVTIDFAAMVPLQFHNYITKLSANRVRKLIVGGGAVDESLLETIKLLDTEIYSSYGMTETITHVALKKLTGKDSVDTFVALDGVCLRADDRDCLVISVKNIVDNDVVTNDIVELISDKEFRWIGRFDNIINSGGVKIHPEKIEQLLNKDISPPFFISSVKDEILGEKVVLVIEGSNQNIDLNFIKSLLPKYNAPKEVFYLSEFVRTSSGKINRKKTIEKLR